MKSPLKSVVLRLWWTLINVGVSIDSVAISPNPVKTNATFLISVGVSQITIKGIHSNLSGLTHSKLAAYTHRELGASPTELGTNRNLQNYKHSELSAYTHEELNND